MDRCVFPLGKKIFYAPLYGCLYINTAFRPTLIKKIPLLDAKPTRNSVILIIIFGERRGRDLLKQGVNTSRIHEFIYSYKVKHLLSLDHFA